MIETNQVQRFDTRIEGAYLIRPKLFKDSRGYFFEGWNKKTFKDIGIEWDFVQDNFSSSTKWTLRGLHYQIGESAQGKLVWVTFGSVFDVFVDLRKNSPTFGQWDGYVLTTQQHDRLWIPPGCAHGFVVLSETVDFQYKCTNFYDPRADRTLLWNDPTLKIPWPVPKDMTLNISEKDQQGKKFERCEKYE